MEWAPVLILLALSTVLVTVCFFFFNDTAPTEIYTTYDTLSLHDALPIYDPPALPEPDRPGRGRARGRGRGPDLLREVGAAAERRGSRDPGRAPQGARVLQPAHPPRARGAAPQRRAEPDAGSGVPHGRRGRALEGVPARPDHASHQLRRRGALFRRVAAGPAGRALQIGRAHV